MLAHAGTSVYASNLTVMSICDKVSKQHSNQKYIHEMAQRADRSLCNEKN